MHAQRNIGMAAGLALTLAAGWVAQAPASTPAHGAAPAVTPAPAAKAAHAEPADEATPSGHAAPETGFDEIGLPLDEHYAAPVDSAALGGGWDLWLAALEAGAGEANSGGQKAGGTGLLYPLDSNPVPGAGAQPYRHLAIAKAVSQLEEKAGTAEPQGHGAGHAQAAATGHAPESATGHGEAHDEATPENRAGSPLLALANARNYLNLSEYDKALEWYAHAAARDVGGDFRRETGREKLAAAICARDTVAAGLAVATTLQATDLVGREAEVVLAFRWLLNRRDTASLGWLVDRTATPEMAADARVSFWRAYALSALDRRPECLAQLGSLLALGGNGRVLNERERCWALTATADLLLLQGSTPAAEALYLRLSRSTVPALRQWGQLQAAGLAFVGHRYTEAGAGYREICQNDKQGVWGPHACAMADIAARLDRLMAEGERYGADAHFRR